LRMPPSMWPLCTLIHNRWRQPGRVRPDRRSADPQL